MPDLETSSTIWVTVTQSVAVVAGTFAATAMGAFIVGRALDEDVDPALLDDEAAAPRRRRMSISQALAQEQEAAAAGPQPTSAPPQSALGK